MKYAILSDIHSNLPALERVLAECSRLGAEQYLICGDLVGYGAQPNECCEIIRELPAAIVRGNHDYVALHPGGEEWFTAAARACIVWTREVLSDDNRDFLADLRPSLQLDGAHLCHGSLPDPDMYTTSATEALYSFQVMEEQCCFLGHTHYAEWYTYQGDGRSPSHHPRPEGGECRLAEERLYVINPGAVGQPRDGNSQASFAFWDTEATLVTIIRVSYDIEAAQAKILEAGLPPNMAERLKYGI